MYRIRRFGVIRTATVVAVAYAIAFAVVFVPIALLGLASGLATQRGGGPVVAGLLLLGVVLLVVYPIVIWVGTALACLVYNLAARWVGGIEVQIERPQQMWPQSPGWMPQPQPGWGAGPGAAPGAWTPAPGQGPPPAAPPYGPSQESWRPPDAGSRERPPNESSDRG